MIYHLNGSIAEMGDDYLVLDVQGVGYQVFVPQSVTSSCGVGEVIKLFTFHQVREDAQLLFGFLTLEDRHLFTLLTSVSGMGPKGAIKTLSFMTVDQFRHALMSEDVFTLTQVPGVGKKLAERMIIELKDKLEKLAGAGPIAAAGSRPNSGIIADLTMALKSLGYSGDEIKRAISRSEGLTDGMSLEAGIKVLLKQLL